MFTIISHNYMNTGGNCMVSVFTVKLNDNIRFVAVNEEGVQLSVIDIFNDPFINEATQDVNDYVVEYLETCELDESHENYDLYSCCIDKYNEKNTRP